MPWLHVWDSTSQNKCSWLEVFQFNIENWPKLLRIVTLKFIYFEDTSCIFVATNSIYLLQNLKKILDAISFSLWNALSRWKFSHRLISEKIIFACIYFRSCLKFNNFACIFLQVEKYKFLRTSPVQRYQFRDFLWVHFSNPKFTCSFSTV